jgi:hypothetical protein
MANGYYRTRKEAEARAKSERHKTGYKYKVVKVAHRQTNPGSSAKYAVSSVEGKTTYHRLLTGANKEYFRRYHRGDQEITIDNLQTGQRVKKSTSKIVSPAKKGSYTFSGGTYKRNKRHTRRSNPGGPLDTHAARELELFVENDADLYRQQYTPINKNLVTKMARGVYNHSGAVKLFGYLMESGAKKYIKQHGSVHPYTGRDEWHQVFSPATRKAAAERFAHHFEVEAKLGNYDHLLPKKYSSWRLKSNPNRLTDVLVKRNGRVFKAKAKYDAKLGRVRIYANPAIARKINPSSLQRYDVVVFKLGRKKGERGIDPGWFYGRNVWDYPMGGPYKTKTLAKKAARAAGHTPDPIGVKE